MNIRRWSAGVLAAALFVPGLAACKSEDGSPTAGSTSAAKPADPKEALLASTKELQKGNFTFTIKGGELNGEGTVHLPSKSAEMKMETSSEELSMNMHLVFIDNDSWVKLELGGAMADAVPAFKAMKGKYQHLDRSKLDGVKELSFDFADVDPAGAEKMINAITDVKQTGDGAYEGTIDATKAADSDLLDEDTIKTLGAQASALPFTAKVDGQGRLSELTVQVPAVGSAKAQTLTVTYANYGSATAPKAPAASQVVEASDQLYEMFKG
ncbi:hypothetical protein [Micromonospora eburnea]|uniref:hypothetical protein n=1 Tax=Micromonospora eburnea TaxID=227316 RepID=UPI001FC97735|nr:hypothetical protein [Micromonospora eburnea]